MEINHLLKDVIHLNEYIIATQDVINKFKNIKVTINIATVLTLKKIRSLEIEYLNKCDENGVACIIFERLLETPPSKVWGVLAKELVYLLQYWLEAIRKHLVNHSTHWWMFLKLILKFIKEIRLKDPSIPNMLVELTAECLFDLSTASRPDVFQRHEILHCLNMVCAESSREIRFAMRTKFGEYFVKIASHMATCGYLPAQYSSLECLLRWLVPRQERALRAAAAARWLPAHLCPPPARDLFLTSSWMNFFQDARDFLNALNEGNGLVKSVICRRLCIGEVVIINGTEKQQSWLDFNSSGRSVSVLLDPKVLEAFGVREHRACETLVVDEEITETAILRREPLGLTISLGTARAPLVRPSERSAGGRGLSAVVSSRTDLRALDKAMRDTFRDKYQLLVDLDTEMSQSPQRSYKNKNELNSEEDTRFSHPVEVKRRKHSGYIVRTKNTGGAISPSTASTSSLIQLKDRLAALPRYKFDKEPVSVCAQPALSNVTELTEQDDRSIYTGTTAKFQPYGVCHKSFKTRIDQITESKSRSEGETVKQKSRGGRRLLSPVVSDDNSTSLLLVATVGSTNDSVINETIERLSKSKDFQDDNIVNLIVQEAMQAKPKSREVSDSGINTDDKKSQESEAIDDTPNEIKGLRSRMPLKKVCTIVSKSTTDDESNTEAINETPAFVNTRKVRGKSNPKPDDAEKTTYNVKSVEEFFSQHIAENKRGEIVISPTLAKKINETSSETSENFDENYLLMNEDVYTDVEQTIFNDIDVVDCLNDIVDKVCSDFDKCTEYLFKNTIKSGKETVLNKIDAMNETNYQTPKSKPLLERPKRNIKLKYKPVKKAKARVTKKTKNAEQEKIAKMSTIVEQTEEDTIIEEINPENDVENVNINENRQNKPDIKNLETPIRRRKRKLYSPKDDDVEKEVTEITGDVGDDVPLSKMKSYKTTKTTATCYKELERERKKYTRIPKSRKSKAKVLEMPSPRTLKMNSMFDNLKQTVDSNEKITFVEKNAEVYNFTSESDDDDFKKKVEIKKRVDTTQANLESAGKKGRNTRQRRAKDTDSSYEEMKTKPVKRKKVTKRTTKRNTETKISAADLAVDLVDNLDLVDEKMRDAAREELNTSIVIEKHIDLESTEVEPVLIERPRMEEINENVSNETLVSKVAKKAPVHNSESNDTMISKKSTKELYDISASNDTHKRKTTRKATKTEVDLTNDDKSNDTASKKKVNKKINKKTEILQIKKEKGLAKKEKIVIDRDDDGTMSPLPGLVVESMPNLKEDVNDSLTTNMLQKFKRIYKDGPDINDSTQNMLSDVERFNHSAQHCISIADELFFEDDKENVDSKAEKKVYQRMKDKKTNIKITDDIETINIPDTINLIYQSEKSITSDGINAHGDFDEAPPNPETIKEELQPRELQDLDQSMRDYFNKLTREIHHTKSDEVENNVDKNKSTISPIVSVKRLSFEDISKWMPSRRTSDTDSSQTSKVISQNKTNLSPRRQLQLNKSDETTPKSISTKKTEVQETSPESTKSPIVAVTRISLEDFDKWLPMPKSFEDENNVTSQQKKCSDLKLVYRTRSKSKIKTPPEQRESIKKTTKENAKAVKTDSDSDDTNDKQNFKKASRKDHEINIKKIPTIPALNIPITVKSTTKKRTITKSTDLEENTDQNFESPKTRLTRAAKKDKKDFVESPEKTVGKSKPKISPIKLNELYNIENSSDDECLKKIRSMFAKGKDTIKSNKSVPKESIKRKSTSPILSERKKSLIENDTKVFYEPKVLKESKKIEVLEDVVISESGPSISSVNDWFRRTAPVSHKDAAMSYKDTIQNVMEKLDTTLVEINQNTSKKFVNLFVEAQRKLGEQKDEHRKLFKNVASGLITEMVRVMDEKFAELDSKSQEMGTNFMEKLKQQAFDLIRDDCKKKRAMVLLLKEDVQAVLDHIERSRSADSQ